MCKAGEEQLCSSDCGYFCVVPPSSCKEGGCHALDRFMIDGFHIAYRKNKNCNLRKGRAGSFLDWIVAAQKMGITK